ncbi:MAG: M16 family metallopeptidase [Desulfobacterales bacterium]
MESNINKTVLDNGIRVLTNRMPHVHSISMGVWVNVGARDETPDENGLSHFLEHMIFKGTKRRSSYQIAKEFDAIGGHSNAFTSMENTCYHAKVMDSHLTTMVDILSDIFLNSVFDPEEFEKERSVIFQEIGMVEDNPEDYIHVLSGNAFWGENPLGRSIIGSRENIARFNAKTLKNFFQRFYQPERIVISAAGNLSHDAFVNLIRKAFESIQPSYSLPERITPVGRFDVHLHHRKLEQVHVYIGTKGLAITDPKRYAFSLLNTILGGNMSSRLFQEIRERRGLAYAIYSFFSSHVDTGMFGVYIAVDPKTLLKSIKLILREMRKLKEIRVDPGDLINAKEYTKGGLLLASESVDNQMVRLSQNEIHFGRQIPIKSVIDEIESVSADEIMDLARYLFQSEQLALTMLGPVSDKKSFEDVLFL